MPVGICQLVLCGFFDLFLLPSRKGVTLVWSVRREGLVPSGRFWCCARLHGASGTPPPTNRQKICSKGNAPWRSQDPSLRHSFIRECRGAHCAPVRFSGNTRFSGRTLFAPTAAVWSDVGGGVAGSRSDQCPGGALNRTSGPALLDGGHHFGRQAPTPRATLRYCKIYGLP